MNDYKKKELIEKVAHCLDITPDMYNRAQSVVNGLTHFITNKSKETEIYKQGSFKLGTIIRPYLKDRHGDYDIDLVVQYQDGKNNVSPDEIKHRLGNLLKHSSYYEYLDTEGRRCWTLNYPHINGTTITFHIDLLPCIGESETIKKSISPEKYSNTVIAITNIKDKNVEPYQYNWQSSNPKGFSTWFDSVNYTKYNSYKQNDRRRIFESYRSVFESLESVGDDYTRSPLQMVIQILKRHRDVMFSNAERATYKPISIIITTLVGKIVEENNIVENNTYILLNTVLNGLEFYSSLQIAGMSSDFSDDFKQKKLIEKRFGKDGKPYWSIKSPADSSDNLANRWNEDSRYAVEFFRWVKQAKADLIDILEAQPKEIIAKIKYCLGEDVANAIQNFDFTETFNPRPIATDIVKPKPYKVG